MDVEKIELVIPSVANASITPSCQRQHYPKVVFSTFLLIDDAIIASTWIYLAPKELSCFFSAHWKVLSIDDDATLSYRYFKVDYCMWLLRTQLDDAVMGCAESKRKTSLLEEEIDLIRGKLARVSQEKVKLERDARAATSLTRTWENRVSSDSDFYKRKNNLNKYTPHRRMISMSDFSRNSR